MKLNQDKCHLMISGHKFEAVSTKTGNTQIWERRESKCYWMLTQKMISILKNLKSERKKLGALTGLSNVLNLIQRKI